jgi:hypothetical protein
MELSFQEDRVSADMDRILSSDPVLAVVAELFAEPAPSASRRPAPRRRPRATRPRPTRRATCPGPARRVLLTAVALVALVAALTSAGFVFGPVVAAGVAIVVAIAVATWLVAKPLRTDATAAKRDQFPRI